MVELCSENCEGLWNRKLLNDVHASMASSPESAISLFKERTLSVEYMTLKHMPCVKIVQLTLIVHWESMRGVFCGFVKSLEILMANRIFV